jgi:hypothetical protein
MLEGEEKEQRNERNTGIVSPHENIAMALGVGRVDSWVDE